MRITINGEQHEEQSGSTVTSILNSLGLENKPAAVERNGSLVPAREHASTTLHDGDVLEVVTLVGGG